MSNQGRNQEQNQSRSQISSSNSMSRISQNDDSLDKIDQQTYPSTDTRTQALAYLFQLLPPQESQQFDHRCQEQSDCQEELEHVRLFQTRLQEWSDVPAPTGLAEKTLLLIQKTQKELTHS